MNPKRFFIASSLALGAIILVLLVYNFWPDKNSSRPEETPEEQPQDTQGISDLSQEPVISPVVDQRRERIKYHRAFDGQVLAVDFQGEQKETLSDSVLNNFVKALWSPDTEKALSLFSENGQVKKYLYDYQTKKATTLSENIAWIDWSPTGDKIVYEFLSADLNHNVSVADPDGANWKAVFKTRVPDWQVEWVSKDIISLATPPSGFVQGVLYALNPETENFSKVLSDYYGLKPLWSPKGDKLLYSRVESGGQNLSLWVANQDGANSKEMALTTLADKCVWSADNTSFFCAVPQEIETSAVWPDDYYKGLVSTRDDFYQINLGTGQQIKLFESSNDFFYDASSLMVSDDNDFLFFINGYDNHLYALEI